MRGEGGECGVSANEYSCTHGTQINFGELTPYLFHQCRHSVNSCIRIPGFPWNLSFLILEKSIAERYTNSGLGNEIPPPHDHNTREVEIDLKIPWSRKYPGNFAKDSSIMEKFHKFFGEKSIPLSRLDCFR
jgi:hypothetical protein